MQTLPSRRAFSWVFVPALLVLLLSFLLETRTVIASEASDLAQTTPDIEVFASKKCPHCTAAKLFLIQLQRERPGLTVLIRDVDDDPDALTRLKKLSAEHGYTSVGVPTFHLRGKLIIGFSGPDTTGKQLRALLDRPPSPAKDLPEGACLPETQTPCEETSSIQLPESDTVETSFFGRLSARELGLPLFTLAIGLLDGFNPCAMWVLLFLLSILVNMRSRLKMAIIAGTFVVVSGLVYFAFMAAWLNVFMFIGASRYIQLLLGGIAFLVGAVNVKDFFAFGRGPSLRIPEAAKPAVYTRARAVLQAENLTGSLIAIAVLAVLVNMVELLCTAGFPAVYTHILALREFPLWLYYGYLGLYNVAYMFDDAVMVTIAVATLGHRKLQEKEGRWLKLLSGTIMGVLGAVLIAKPEWLAA